MRMTISDKMGGTSELAIDSVDHLEAVGKLPETMNPFNGLAVKVQSCDEIIRRLNGVNPKYHKVTVTIDGKSYAGAFLVKYDRQSDQCSCVIGYLGK